MVEHGQPSLRPRIVGLDGAAAVTGPAIVIDVLRAFTTAAWALEAGAERILLVATVEEALDLGATLPGSYVMGEVKGAPPPGFHFGNNPPAMAQADLRGRTLIHRTTAGTQGVIRVLSNRPQPRTGNGALQSPVWAASMAVARATATDARPYHPLTYVCTGIGPEAEGDADIACAEYLFAAARGPVDPAAYLDRIRRSSHGRTFTGPPRTAHAAEDLEAACAVDRCGFAMRVRMDPEGPVLARPNG